MSKGDRAAEAAIFAALGDPTRLVLVERMLAGRARSLGALADGLPISRQAVRKHLAVLERSGLATAGAVGREQHFRIRKAEIERARAYLETVAAQWDDALDRLKDFVER